MYILDKDKAKKILTNELGYETGMVDLYLNSFPALDNRFSEAVNGWLENRRILDISFEGISIKQIMEVQNCHFLNAVRSLNDLLTQADQQQKEALKRFLLTPFTRR